MLDEKVSKAREEYDNLPKREEAYIHEFSKEIEHLKEQKLSYEKVLRKNIDDNSEIANESMQGQNALLYISI